MKTTQAFRITALVVVAVLASVAAAGAPMGPPTATLEEKQWSFSAEFGLEEMDMEASGKVSEDLTPFFWRQEFTIEDYEAKMLFGTIQYGLFENWAVFARFGGANGSGDIVASPASASSVEVSDTFDGDAGFAWGLGTRATFGRSGPWSFGGLVQVTWFNPGDSDYTVADPLVPGAASWIGDVEISYWQTQISLAAAYQVDTLQIWFGPFFQFIKGDMDFDGRFIIAEGGGEGNLTWTSDLEESSQLGVHAGLDWELVEQTNLWVEGQLTSDSWLLGLGLAFSTQETFGK